jgi:hypothetical protein
MDTFAELEPPREPDEYPTQYAAKKDDLPRVRVTELLRALLGLARHVGRNPQRHAIDVALNVMQHFAASQ